MDSTVIATSLPAIARGSRRRPDRAQARAHLLPAVARGLHSDQRLDGRPLRRAHACSAPPSCVFTLGSVGLRLRAIASPISSLRRIIQGMGGAMMVPVGRLVILRTVPKARARRRAGLAHRAGPARPRDRAAARRLHHHLSSSGAGSSGSTFRSASSASSSPRASSPNIKEEDAAAARRRGLHPVGVGLAGLVFGFDDHRARHPAAPLVAALLLAVGALLVWLYVRPCAARVGIRSSISGC